MNKFLDIKNSKIIFIIITWISFFLSINLSPADFNNFSIINKLRILSPLILLIIFVFFEFKFFKLNNYNKFYQIFFIIIILLYFYFNITSPKNLISNFFWPLYMFLSFFFLISLNKRTDLEIIFKFTFVIIGLAFLFYLSAAILEMINRKNFFFYGIGINYIGLESPPRSSGLSRLSMLIFAFLSTYYIVKKKYNNYFILASITFFGFFTLVFQSRTMTFIFFVYMMINIILNFKKFFFNKKIIIFSLILPVALSIIYIYSATQLRAHFYDLDKTFSYIVKDTLIRDQYSPLKNKETEFSKKMNRFSSDRFENWKKATNLIKKNNFKGYGPQADRIFIDQSIHNAVLYSTLSGGIISGIAVIFIYILSIYYFIKIYFYESYQSTKEFETKLAINIVIILNLRSLLETSFAVFSIDYLIYIMCFVYLYNLLQKNYS